MICFLHPLDNQNFPLLEKIVAKSNNLSQAKGIIEKVKLNPEADGVKLDVVSEENREEAKPAKPVDLDSPDIRQEPVEPKPPNDEMEKVPVDSGLEIPVEKHEEPAREDGGNGGNEIVVKKEIIEEVIKEEVQAKVKEAQKEIEAAKEEHEVKVKEKEEELQNREEKADKLLQELEKQKLEQKEIIKEQKEVLKAMKEHVDGDQDHQLKIEEQIDPKHGDDKIPSYEIVQDVIKESADDLSKLKVMDPSRDISNLRQKQPHVPNVEVVRKDKPRVIIGDTIQQEIPYQPRSSLHKVESNSVFNKNPELLANNSKPYSLRGSGSHELVNKSLPRREDDPDKNPSRDLKSVKEISLLKEESGVGEQRVKRDGGDADSIFEETVIGGIVDETLCENCGQFNVQSVEKRLK